MANLALKYRPQTFEDVTEQTMVVNILKAMCEQPELPNRNFLLTGPRGCGKAQPLDSLVLTPKGYVFMGDIHIGDEVLTHNGNIGRVAQIYPQGVRDIYQILLDDGTFIEVSDNHLNLIWVNDIDGNVYSEEVVLDTVMLKQYLDSLATINPYCKYVGIPIPFVNWEEKLVDLDKPIEDILRSLEEFDISYIVNSTDVRIAILRKIFESTLSDLDDLKRLVQDNNLVVIIDKERVELSSAVAWIVRSLGCKDTILVTSAGIRHCIELSPEVLHKLLKDRGKIENTLEKPLRYIESVKLIGKKECQCLMIDHPDHTYISNDFIPTHNTTLGRIIANKLNEGKGTPIELDAASHSGVDTVRSLVAQAQQYPIGSKYKVFIADEVHSFSQTAWQSFLKVLEEQPAMSVFILLTTNPEKIPTTILSRVQKFQLSNISLDGITSRLKYVVEEENKTGKEITYTEEALSYIAKLAKGGMRDALTLLDRALVYSEDITELSLKNSLDIPEYDDYFSLLNAYAKKDNEGIMTIIYNVYNSGINFSKWFEGFQSFVINVAKYIFIKDISKTMIPSYYKDRLDAYSEKHAVLCLQLSQTLVELISKISTTEYVEEVAISYMCQRR